MSCRRSRNEASRVQARPSPAWLLWMSWWLFSLMLCPCCVVGRVMQTVLFAMAMAFACNRFRGRRPAVRVWPLFAMLLAVAGVALWMAPGRAAEVTQRPFAMAWGMMGWALVSLGVWWWACAARSTVFFATLTWGTALLLTAFPRGDVWRCFASLPPAAVAAPLILRRDVWCRAAGWALVGLTVAMPWLAGNSLWVLAALGVWLALQPVYAVAIETIRRGDRRVAPVGAYALGAENAEMAAVLLHGFADTPEAWRREAEALAARGFRVLAPELSHDAGAAEWLATVRETFAEARARHRRVTLWGHSMGGAVALAAVARGLRPDALVLWAPFLAPRLGWGLARALYGLHRALFLWPHTLTWFPSERHGKGPVPTAYRVRRVIPVRTFAAMLGMPSLVVPPAEVPTLALLSRRDTVVDNRATRAALRSATFLEAADPRTGHALTNAVDWPDNLAASLAWLDSVGGS